MTANRYIVTGASGFVGSRLAAFLGGRVEPLAMSPADWEQRVQATRFEGAVVLHLAGRAHRAGERALFHRDNAEKTRVLAESAARGGARRFVFLSSIKVNGERTAGHPFTDADPPAPADDYGRSKREAEEAVIDVSGRLGMPGAIVRCPLVYGAAAKGHLATLMRIADSPLPLPLGAIRNRRSFIAVDDLCRALARAACVEAGGVHTYLVAHRETLSTPGLVERVRRALGRKPRLYAMPPAALRALAAMSGVGGMMRRLTESLEIDPARAERELAWRAEIGPDEAIDSMVRAWRTRRP